MFRQLLEEAFEELRQTVAPARPEIGLPIPPPTSYEPLPAPAEAQKLQTTAAPATSETPAPVKRSTHVVHTHRPSRVRAQLNSRSSLRSAFLMMEVLGPPVALRESREREQGR